MSWTSKGSCSQEERCFFGHDPAKKGKGKGEMNNPTSLRHFLLKVHVPERRKDVLRETRIDFFVSITKEEHVSRIESAIVGIPPACKNISSTVNFGWERVVHTSTSKNKIDLAVFHRKTKDKEKLSEEGYATMAVA